MSFTGRVSLSPGAKRDLVGIWVRIAENNREAATPFLRGIANKFPILAQYPQLGRSREELQPGLRTFVVRNYLIIYREIAGGVEIVRVLHGARYIETTLPPYRVCSALARLRSPLLQ